MRPSLIAMLTAATDLLSTGRKHATDGVLHVVGAGIARPWTILTGWIRCHLLSSPQRAFRSFCTCSAGYRSPSSDVKPSASTLRRRSVGVPPLFYISSTATHMFNSIHDEHIVQKAVLPDSTLASFPTCNCGPGISHTKTIAASSAFWSEVIREFPNHLIVPRQPMLASRLCGQAATSPTSVMCRPAWLSPLSTTDSDVSMMPSFVQPCLCFPSPCRLFITAARQRR